MTHPSSICIIGAGHCGGRTAQVLRELGFSGRIDLVGDEPGLPYERPALSKDVLTAAKPLEQLDLASEVQLQQWGIQRHHARVQAVDPVARSVLLSDGRTLLYGALLFANGGAPRRLSIPGADLPQVFTLRTKADAQRLAPQLAPGRRIVVIGGGFIGLEVAASARTLGCHVHLLEGAPQLMGRAVPRLIADRALALHQAQGVDIRVGVSPVQIAQKGTALEVTLSDGTALQADAVVVGIGIVPGTEVAQAAGVQVARGILVDRCLRTSVDNIYAAGDVAEFPSHLTGTLQRQETWQNAESQARVAAQNLMGGHVEFAQSAWFWSDQFDHQLQVSGEPTAGTHTTVREMGDGDVLLFYTDANQRLVGASGWGLSARIAKDLKLARTLVERGVVASSEALANPDTKLKSLLR